MLAEAKRLREARSEEADYFFAYLVKRASDPSLQVAFDERAECLAHSGYYLYYAADQLENAILAAKHSVFIADSGGLATCRRLSYTTLGVLQTELGDYSSGLSTSLEGLRIAMTLQDREKQALMLVNFGGILINISRFDAAIGALELAVSLEDPLGSNEELSMAVSFTCRANLLLVAMLQERRLSDESIIDYCFDRLAVQPSNRNFSLSKSIFLSVAVRYFLQVKELVDSSTKCNAAKGVVEYELWGLEV